MVGEVVDEGGKLVKVEEAAFVAMDRWDEEQILAELEGQVVQGFVYEFPQDGKTVRGLSWAGTKEVSRHAGNLTAPSEKIRVMEWKNHDGETIQEVVVEVVDLATGVSRIGTSQINPLMHTKKRGNIPDKFAFTKAVSKAQRNGLRHHIPEALAIKLIAEFVKANKVVKRQPEEFEGPPSDYYTDLEDKLNEAKTLGILKETADACLGKKRDKKITAGEYDKLKKLYDERVKELK